MMHKTYSNNGFILINIKYDNETFFFSRRMARNVADVSISGSIAIRLLGHKGIRPLGFQEN